MFYPPPTAATFVMIDNMTKKEDKATSLSIQLVRMEGEVGLAGI